MQYNNKGKKKQGKGASPMTDSSLLPKETENQKIKREEEDKAKLLGLIH